MNIYVGNLAYTTNDQELLDAFEAFGKVTRATVIMDRETGRSKGFGFVEMANNAEAEEAIQAMNGRNLSGRTIRVNQAEERKPRDNNGPRRRF